MSKVLHICGLDPLLGIARSIAEESYDPGLIRDVHLREITPYNFDLSVFDELSIERDAIFVALDCRANNFSRLEVYGALKARGFEFVKLISSQASIAADCKISENSLIAAGVVVGSKVKIGYNTVINSSSVIDVAAKVGNSAYLGQSVRVGAEALIGDFTTIGSGIVLESAIKIGKQSIVDKQGRYCSDVKDKTFYLTEYAEPIRIISF